jgi:hypothetical protein
MSDTKTEFNDAKKLCTECEFQGRKEYSSEPSKYQLCYGTPQRVVNDYTSGKTKRQYLHVISNDYDDSTDTCGNVNPDGNCEYFEPKKPAEKKGFFAWVKSL